MACLLVLLSQGGGANLECWGVFLQATSEKSYSFYLNGEKFCHLNCVVFLSHSADLSIHLHMRTKAASALPWWENNASKHFI